MTISRTDPFPFLTRCRSPLGAITVAAFLICGTTLCIYALFGYRKADFADVQSLTGLKSLAEMARWSTNVYGYRTNYYLDFERFVLSIRGEAPNVVGDINSANPFPGVLPKGREYSHLSEKIQIKSGAVMPLLWDSTPTQGRKRVALFSDLSVREVMLSDLPRLEGR
jgi:hypothetical protein